jgi:hypothetical protein
MSRSLLSCASALALLLSATPSATVTVPADLATLVAGASVIAHAHASVVEARVVSGRRAIERVVTFQVERYFRGDLGAEIRVIVPGGDLGPYRTVMIGAPHFRQGDEVVLFLLHRGTEPPHILGLSQGVYRVITDGANGRRVVVPAIALPAAGSAEPVVLRRGDRSRRPTPLAEFAATVERLVADQLAGEEGR